MPVVAGEVVVERVLYPGGTKLRCTWKVDGSGNAEVYLDDRLTGYVWRIEARPDNVTAAYSVQLLDENGYDALAGIASSLSASDTQQLYVCEDASPTVAVAQPLNGLYRLVIDAAANDYGVVEIWIRDAPQGESSMPASGLP